MNRQQPALGMSTMDGPGPSGSSFVTVSPVACSVATICSGPPPALAIHRILLAWSLGWWVGSRKGHPNGTATIAWAVPTRCGTGCVGGSQPARAQVGRTTLTGSGHVRDARSSLDVVDGCGGELDDVEPGDGVGTVAGGALDEHPLARAAMAMPSTETSGASRRGRACRGGVICCSRSNGGSRGECQRGYTNDAQ
jgi:hypothetical protein